MLTLERHFSNLTTTSSMSPFPSQPLPLKRTTWKRTHDEDIWSLGRLKIPSSVITNGIEASIDEVDVKAHEITRVPFQGCLIL